MEEIGLLTTTLVRWDSAKIYFPNAVLLAQPLHNVSRSYKLWESFSTMVDATLTEAQVAALNERVRIFAETNSADFTG